MNYRLYGFSSFVEGALGFLVPVYCSEKGNRYYSHFLDENGVITNFFCFDAEKYALFPIPEQGVLKKVGDLGIFCFRPLGGELIIGVLPEVTFKLREERLAERGEALSNVEAFSFLSDDEGRQAAIQDVGQAVFSNDNTRSTWLNGEGRCSSIGLYLEISASEETPDMVPVSSSEKFDFLWNKPNARNWIKLWQGLWDEGYNPEGMVTLALWWLSRATYAEGLVPLYRALLEDEFSREQSQKSLIEFLEALGPLAGGWVRLWIVAWHYAVFKKEHRERLEDMGLNYLTRVLNDDKGSRHVGRWVSIWKLLTKDRKANDTYLSTLPLNSLPLYYRDRAYWRDVAEPFLKRSVSGITVSAPLFDLLRRSEKRPFWRRCVAWILKHYPENTIFDDRIIDILCNEETSSRRWIQTWDIIESLGSKRTLLLAISKTAVAQGLIPNNAVPHVLMQLTKYRFDEDAIAACAASWLSNNDEEEFSEPIFTVMERLAGKLD